MIIVVIHWKIRADDESLEQFREQWRAVELPEPRHFSAEYLSEPLSLDEADFPCTTFNVSADVPYKSFFNVAIWKDLGLQGRRNRQVRQAPPRNGPLRVRPS